MSERIEGLLHELAGTTVDEGTSRVAYADRTAWLRRCTAEEVVLLLHGLAEGARPVHPALLTIILAHLVARQSDAGAGVPAPPEEEAVRRAVALYRGLSPDSPARVPLLQWLACARTAAALAAFADFTVVDPPAKATGVAIAFGPLFQHRDYDPTPLFPRLFDALPRISVAPAVLDLANFVTREGLLPRHPGAARVSQLAELLSGLVGRLARLETSPPADASAAKTIGAQINAGVALAVSLCDALAQIGDTAVVGKLYQASELSHRRVRTEAAAALACLGEEAGREMLVQLAAEPVARLRVLAYAEELGLLDRVDARYQTAPARAEAELALWLSQPQQMSFPPTVCELIDSRTQYWPGYEEPVECFLFRFTYVIGDGQFSNIGIVGPLTHAFGADFSGLPVADIYAGFAGWQAEHPEIYELEVTSLNEAQHVEVARLQRRLHDEGFGTIQPLRLVSFFGERVPVARATWEGQPGAAVVDREQTYWLPRTDDRRAPGPDEAYCIYKGRRLLRAFNE
jgi:hypothetical protein